MIRDGLLIGVDLVIDADDAGLDIVVLGLDVGLGGALLAVDRYELFKIDIGDPLSTPAALVGFGHLGFGLSGGDVLLSIDDALGQRGFVERGDDDGFLGQVASALLGIEQGERDREAGRHQRLEGSARRREPSPGLLEEGDLLVVEQRHLEPARTPRQAQRGAGQLLQGLLYGVNAVEPVVLVAAPLILLASSLLASYIAALRATRVDPTVALRAE